MPVKNILPLPGQKLGDLLHVFVPTTRKALGKEQCETHAMLEKTGRTTTICTSFGRVLASRTASQTACDDSKAAM